MDWKDKIAMIWHDQTGTTTVEYALILAVIFFAMLSAAEAFGLAFFELWDTTSGIVSGSIGA